MTDKKNLNQGALEKLIKETFCNLQTVMGCGYAKENWCEKTCGYYKRAEQKIKYWNR